MAVVITLYRFCSLNKRSVTRIFLLIEQFIYRFSTFYDKYLRDALNWLHSPEKNSVKIGLYQFIKFARSPPFIWVFRSISSCISTGSWYSAFGGFVMTENSHHSRRLSLVEVCNEVISSILNVMFNLRLLTSVWPDYALFRPDCSLLVARI